MKHDIIHGVRKKAERRSPDDVPAQKRTGTHSSGRNWVSYDPTEHHLHRHACTSVHTTTIRQLLKSLFVIFLTFTRLFFFERHEKLSGRTTLLFGKTDTIGPFIHNLPTTSVCDVPHTLTRAHVTTRTKELTLFTRRCVHTNSITQIFNRKVRASRHNSSHPWRTWPWRSSGRGH